MKSPEELDQLRSELAALTTEVNASIQRRRDWMDQHMPDFAEFQVGDEIYNGDGKLLGIVTKLYRFWGGGRDDRYDTSMHIHYVYEERPQSFDNTSRQSGKAFYSRAQTARRFDDDWVIGQRRAYDAVVAECRVRITSILQRGAH